MCKSHSVKVTQEGTRQLGTEEGTKARLQGHESVGFMRIWENMLLDVFHVQTTYYAGAVVGRKKEVVILNFNEYANNVWVVTQYFYMEPFFSCWTLTSILTCLSTDALRIVTIALKTFLHYRLDFLDFSFDCASCVHSALAACVKQYLWYYYIYTVLRAVTKDSKKGTRWATD